MKLRVLICLFLTLIIVSDVTLVAAHTYIPDFDYGFDNLTEWHIFAQGGPVTIKTLVPPLTQGTGAIQVLLGRFNFMRIGEHTPLDFAGGSVMTLDVHTSTPYFIIEIISNVGTIYYNDDIPIGRSNISFIVRSGCHSWIEIDVTHGCACRHNMTVDNGTIIFDNLRVNGIGGFMPPPPTPINLSHALNFTLAGAMALPTMSIGVVDDIMLTVGKYIKCGITKFAIRAALLKFAAKGVAITVAITGISYLLAEFADDIYNAIFVTIPEIHPGDTHFHKNDLPQVMGIIHSHFPTEPHITMAIEQAIRLHIDTQGDISIAEVMTIVRHKQKDIVIDVYKETPEILPDNINVHKDQVPEIMDMVDEYFPTEIPIRNIIEEEIHRRIDNNEFNEIPFNEVIDIIEQEQNIYIPEVPTQTPEQHQEYVNDLINRVIHEDPYIPTIETPAIFPGIPATPTTPRTPKRPNEKIHTFPFYSIFVDPLASVIGITLAHLFTAMMIIGAIISIGATWGTIGAIFAGFIGTITTAYFGLTSWLIPVFLIILLIIYANIRIKGGGG